MELHPLAQAFAGVAEDYERGRPDYPAEAIDAIRIGLMLDAGARIADVGAGTGKLTRALSAAGFDVTAVEPLPGMRARLQAQQPKVAVLEGTAEALPLDDGSVDAVACADAFHWFDGERAVAELARVIRPVCGQELLWNHPAVESRGRA
jgi:ubiquinone/menaquinone biosynthesis C-methylase UbiE